MYIFMSVFRKPERLFLPARVKPKRFVPFIAPIQSISRATAGTADAFGLLPYRQCFL
jgi:hypothetical protein